MTGKGALLIAKLAVLIALFVAFGSVVGWFAYQDGHRGAAKCDDFNTAPCEKSVNAIVVVSKHSTDDCYGLGPTLYVRSKHKNEYLPTTPMHPTIMGLDSNIECFQIEGEFKDAFQRGANYITGDMVTGARVTFYSSTVTTVRGKHFCHRWVDGKKQSCTARIKVYGQ